MKFLSGIPVQTFCAYFDLKNANVFIYDGYIGPGLAAGSFLVNNAGTVATQTLTLSATAVGGSGSTDFDFLGAKSTVAWASTYTAAGLQASLVSIPTIGAGGVTVTGTTGAGPFTVTFAGVLASEPQTNLITVDSDNSMETSGSAPITFVSAAVITGVYAYAVAATTMLIDTGTGIWSVGDTFKIVPTDTNRLPDDNVYTVTAHTETDGNTTSITFTPGLSVGVQDDQSLTIQPHSLNVKLGDGNCTWTEKKPREYKKNRGFLDAVRNGDEDPLEIKLEFAWVFIKSSSGEAIMVEDALKQTGQAAGWVTAGVDPCEPYCVRLQIYYVPPCPGVDNEIIDLAEFRYEELQHDAKTGMIACTAKCNLTQPTVTRVAKDAFNQVITH